MKNIPIYIMSALAMVIFACTGDNLVIPSDSEGSPIEFLIGNPPQFTDAAGTRSVIDGDGTVQWEEGDVLHITMFCTLDGSLRYGTVRYTSSGWVADNNMRWPAGGITGTVMFRAWYADAYTTTDFDFGPAYLSAPSNVTAGDPVTLTFEAMTNQYIFRGLAAGQTVTITSTASGIIMSATGTNFDWPSAYNKTFTCVAGEDVVLYLFPDTEALEYSISDGGTGSVYYMDPDGERHIIHCGAGSGGGASAGAVAERSRFLKWYAGDRDTDFTLACDITLTEALTAQNLPADITFDGGGHTIRGLAVSAGTDDAGLFTQNSGTIKNVIIEGASIEDGYAGAIAGYNNGIVIGCQVIGCTIEGVLTAGGITGYNEGTVAACYVGGGTIGGTASYGAGGIVGYNVGTVVGCYYAGTAWAVVGDGMQPAEDTNFSDSAPWPDATQITNMNTALGTGGYGWEWSAGGLAAPAP